MFNVLANPYQTPGNFFKLKKKDPGCCGENEKECRNVFKGVQLTLLGLILFCVVCYDTKKETPHEIDLGGATDAAGLKDLIVSKMQQMIPEGGAGTVSDNPDSCVEVTDNGDGTVDIAIDTDLNIKAFKGTDDVEIVPEKICDKVKVCKVQFMVEKGEATYDISDADGNIVTVGPFADGSTVAADFEAAIGGLGISFESVTSEESADALSCIVTVESTEVEKILLNGSPGVDCGCVEQWPNDEGDEIKELSIALFADSKFGGKGKLNAKASDIQAKLAKKK